MSDSLKFKRMKSILKLCFLNLNQIEWFSYKKWKAPNIGYNSFLIQLSKKLYKKKAHKKGRKKKTKGKDQSPCKQTAQ
jgi:hypothetical protein